MKILDETKLADLAEQIVLTKIHVNDAMSELVNVTNNLNAIEDQLRRLAASEQPQTPTEPEQPSALVPLVTDDFSRYSSTVDLRKNINKNIGGTGEGRVLYSDGQVQDSIFLNTSVLFKGKPTIEYTFRSDRDTDPNLSVYLPVPLSSLWFRYIIKYSKGFTTEGAPVTMDSARAYKVCGLGWKGYDGRCTIEITNRDQYVVNMGAKNRATSKYDLPFREAASDTRVTSEWNDESVWMEYIMHLRPDNANNMLLNGFHGVYGGELAAFPQLMSTRPAGIVSVDRIMLGLNMNRIPYKTQGIYIGQWEVYDGSVYADPFKVY